MREQGGVCERAREDVRTSGPPSKSQQRGLPQRDRVPAPFATTNDCGTSSASATAGSSTHNEHNESSVITSVLRPTATG